MSNKNEFFHLGRFVLQVYVKVNEEAEHNEDIKRAAREFFRQLERREGGALSLWQRFREITMKEYQQIYEVPSCSESF